MEFAKLKIGIIGVVSLALATFLIFLFTSKRKFFTKEIPLHVFMSNATGLNRGSSVRINGISAGKITEISLSGALNPQRAIKIDFNVDQNMLKQIPADSVVSIGSNNLLGTTSFLQINKGTSEKKVQPNATLQAANTPQFNQIVAQGYSVLDTAQTILGKATDIVGRVENGKGTLGKVTSDEAFQNSMQAVANQVERLGTRLTSKKGPAGHLNAIDQQVQDVTAKVADLNNNMQTGQGTVGMLLKDRKLQNGVQETTAQWNTLLGDLKAGKGTAGQLSADGKITRHLSATLGKVTTIADKINSGQGTVGQLAVNPSLKQSISGTTREFHEAMKDFRANPKKFFTIKFHLF